MDRCNGVYEVISVESTAADLVAGDRRIFQKALLIPRRGGPNTMGVQLNGLVDEDIKIGDYFEITIEPMRPEPVESLADKLLRKERGDALADQMREPGPENFEI